MENINIPDGLPSLASGAHLARSGRACVMEYISVLAGEAWSDRPKCTDLTLGNLARHVNDILPDEYRQRLVPFIGRLMGTSGYADKSGEEWVTFNNLAEDIVLLEVRNEHTCKCGGCDDEFVEPETVLSAFDTAVNEWYRVTSKDEPDALTTETLIDLHAAVLARV
jgi:hypothetical protein